MFFFQKKKKENLMNLKSNVYMREQNEHEHAKKKEKK